MDWWWGGELCCGGGLELVEGLLPLLVGCEGLFGLLLGLLLVLCEECFQS